MRSPLPLVLALTACGGYGEATPPDGVRVVTGKLTPPDPSSFTRSQVALQFAAAALDAREASPLVDLALGPAFSPAENGGAPVSFRLALPADRSYVLFLQVPVDGAGRLGALAARLTFAKNGAGELGTLVGGRLSDGGPIVDLELGTVNIARPRASEAPSVLVATLGSDGSVNPLTQNDIDADGVPDVDDADDDDDLVPDDGDPDANGDGVPDTAQVLEALPDADADDVPDLFEGIP